MPVMERIDEAQSQVLETLETAQNRVIEANEKLVGRLGDRRPTWEGKFAERLPEPKKAVKNYYDFVGSVLKVNRTFAERMVDLWLPTPKAAPSTTQQKPAGSAKRATKSTAARKRTAARRTKAAS